MDSLQRAQVDCHYIRSIRVTVTSLWIQQYNPPRWRYTMCEVVNLRMLANCCVWNYTQVIKRCACNIGKELSDFRILLGFCSHKVYLQQHGGVLWQSTSSLTPPNLVHIAGDVINTMHSHPTRAAVTKFVNCKWKKSFSEPECTSDYTVQTGKP